MRYFKHKPTGDIYEYYPKDNELQIVGGLTAIPFRIAEKGNDWEEVCNDNKEWTILSFINKHGDVIRKVSEDGYGPANWTKDRMIANSWRINSVHRESDGEVFTIGDNIKLGGNTAPIVGMDYTLTGIFARINGGGYGHLGNATKIKHKEWEITALRDKGNKQIMHLPLARTLENLLNSHIYSVKTGSLEIYSVKRLSDGVEFKIGDSIKVTKPCKASFKISHLYYAEKDCMACGDYDLKYAEKVEKLFTTEDRVDIYKGDKVWIVFKDWDLEMDIVPISNGFVLDEISKYFFNKTAAEEYIFMNKPRFTTQEVCDSLSQYYKDKGFCNWREFIINKAKQK